MSRLVVTVATGQYIRGALRLRAALGNLGEATSLWTTLPPGCPRHRDVPYAFKPRALELAAVEADQLLWADACILPIGSLDRIWDRAAKYGAWIGRNGWQNGEWTADSAYPALDITREQNFQIPHVVATAFAVDLRRPAGRNLLQEYCRLGLHTDAFKGPWTNAYTADASGRSGPCGGSMVRGHRHDQTALSVLAWRFGIPLTDSPDFFAYGKQGEPYDPRTILLADGSY